MAKDHDLQRHKFICGIVIIYLTRKLIFLASNTAIKKFKKYMAIKIKTTLSSITPTVNLHTTVVHGAHFS